MTIVVLYYLCLQGSASLLTLLVDPLDLFIQHLQNNRETLTRIDTKTTFILTVFNNTAAISSLLFTWLNGKKLFKVSVVGSTHHFLDQ